ncbi:MAG: metal-dependent hydrolase [Planctomycetes bacterium]|nr:metal-dependent hydrolase [Planctomycetota bacterium]
MSPATHLLLSWLIAQGGRDRRERLAITLAGVAPDADGLGLVAGLATGSLDRAQDWYHQWHHQVTHPLVAGVVMALAAWAWCHRSWRVLWLALAAFHLHLLCDVAGSRGPDGDQWGIPYLAPLCSWTWTWDGQWELNAWPNFLTTLTAEAAILALAWTRGISPVELLSPGLDRRFIALLRRWLPPTRGDTHG